MNHRSVTRWLKGIAIAIGVAELFVFLVYIPLLGKDCVSYYPQAAHLYIPCLIFAEVVGVLCLAGVVRFWQIIGEIENDRAFSQRTACLLVSISRLSLAVASLLFICFVALTLTRYFNATATLILLLGAFCAIVMAVATGALSHLVLKAAKIKEENDMTV